MTGHTPGPWSLGADGEKINTNYRDKYGNMTDDNWLRGGWAKSVAKVLFSTWMTPGEARANACLISAAPDMLAALKASNDKLRSVVFDGDDHPLVAANNEAIAKAEGRT